MLLFRNKRALRDALILIGLGVFLIVVLIQLDFHDWLHELLDGGESYEIDEIFIALMVIGVMGYIFGYRRLRDLRLEISRRNQAERDVTWISSHDMLTRLPNRIGLKFEVERLRATAHGNEKFAAMTIDIDGFRHVNDVYGAELGDEILIVVADRLREVFVDCYLFSLGGDQFFAAAEGYGEKEWEKLAKRAIKALSVPVSAGSGVYEVRANVGMAKFPEDAANVSLLLRCTMTALNVAKQERTGEPRWFDVSMDQAIAKRADIDRQLRAALASGEVRPFYQPMTDLATGQIIGFEALARWKRPDGSFVPPSDFIPIAEESGLIGELSDVLFRQACRDAVAWPSSIFLSFNISPVQLADRHLPEQITATLIETGLPARRLELEITESVIVKDASLAAATLGALRNAGVHVAIDDFGTGYSSLSQLSRLRFDKLKIDRSFVASFQDDERQAKIVRAMIGLGRGLGMKTIAEGIEDESQAETLRLLGCHQGQGFLFGRAVTAEQAAAMLDISWPNVTAAN